MYFMIIGELSSVESIKNRLHEKEMLKEVLRKVNVKYGDVIASNFMLTVGNEFQGVLSDGTSIMEIIDWISVSMGHTELLFGIGIGDIETRISKLSIGVDGPAYWNAREAILAVHEDDDYGRTNILIRGDENINIVHMMNEALRLCGYVESRWRDTQREVVEKSILLHGHDLGVKQIQLAKDMGLTTQALNQRIQSSGYYNYIRTRREIAQLLQTEWGEAKR